MTSSEQSWVCTLLILYLVQDEPSRSRNEIHQFVRSSFVGTPIYSGLNDDGPEASHEASSSSAVSSCGDDSLEGPYSSFIRWYSYPRITTSGILRKGMGNSNVRRPPRCRLLDGTTKSVPACIRRTCFKVRTYKHKHNPGIFMWAWILVPRSEQRVWLLCR